jgi:hypothetical protein
MITTPFMASLNTKSPGLMIVPSILSGTWTAWGFASAPDPTIEVPLDQIWVI